MQTMSNLRANLNALASELLSLLAMLFFSLAMNGLMLYIDYRITWHTECSILSLI